MIMAPAKGGEYMYAKWMRLWGMVAVVLLLAPLMAVAQYGSEGSPRQQL